MNQNFSLFKKKVHPLERMKESIQQDCTVKFDSHSRNPCGSNKSVTDHELGEFATIMWQPIISELKICTYLLVKNFPEQNIKNKHNYLKAPWYF